MALTFDQFLVCDADVAHATGTTRRVELRKTTVRVVFKQAIKTLLLGCPLGKVSTIRIPP